MEKGKMTFLLALLISMLGTNASAHDIEVANDGVTIYYKFINNNTELAVSFRGSYYYDSSNEYTGNVVIPATVTYNGTTYSVTSIEERAFSGCSGLTNVEIPNSVTSIGNYAFSVCSNLRSVTIPNSVTSIGNYAFSGSNLRSVTIPNSVTSIGDAAFRGCSGLTSPVYTSTLFAYLPESFSGQYIIPDGIKEICGGAFSGCSSLTSVTIPKSVTSIGDCAFDGCI